MKIHDQLNGLGKTFRNLLLADSFILLSMMISHVAVPWWIIAKGGGYVLTVYVVTVAFFSFVFLPLLAPLADRYSKPSIIILGLVGMAVEATALALLASVGLFEPILIIGLSLIGVISVSLIRPASGAIVADVLPSDRLQDGLVLQKTMQSLGRFVGPLLAGVFLAGSGVAAALWVQVALLSISIFAVVQVRVDGTEVKSEKHTFKMWKDEVWDGLAAKWKIPMERGWTAVSFVGMLFLTPGIGLLLPLKVATNHGSGTWLAICEASLALGMVIGAFWGAKYFTEKFGRYLCAVGSIFLSGVCLLIIGISPSLFLVAGACFAVGLFVTTAQLVGQTHRMLAAPKTFRSRMAGANMMVMQIAGVLGPSIAGICLTVWSPDGVLILFGICLSLVALMYVVVPNLKLFLGLSPDSIQDYYLVNYAYAFADRRPSE